MRRLIALAAGALAAGALATPATADSAKAGVKTKVFISNALLVGGGDVELLGGLSSRNDACEARRKVVVFDDGGDKLGATKAKDGNWEFRTGAVGRGDAVYAKVKRKIVETDRRVVCKGGKSKTFALGG